MEPKVWDFECPQYVDFQRELDNSGKDDIFFDCKDNGPENGNLCTPEVQGKGKGLTESDENRLLGKMTAALSLLENTPKIKKSASRGKLFPESTSKGTHSKVTKSAVKSYTVPAPCPKSRRSKSLDHLNNIISNKGKKKKLRKSSSLNDLKIHNRLMKYPVTPMCLKRTIFKAKEKIVKTTEEMELEQIAKLQKQLIQHLRQNEISLKRLNLRPRQCAISKALPKSHNLKDTKAEGVHEEKSKIVEKESRRNIRTLSEAAMKKEASKLDTIISNKNISSKKTTIYSRKSKGASVSTFNSDVQSHKSNHAVEKEESSKQDAIINSEVTSSRKTNTIYSRKGKTLSACTADSDLNKSTVQRAKKLTHKRIPDHSGLMFVPSVKSNIGMKSFIFEEKTKELKSKLADAKQKETSALNLKENSNKENRDCVKAQFSRKTLGTQNIKQDFNKVAESNKRSLRRTCYSDRKGVPLAENVVRD